MARQDGPPQATCVYCNQEDHIGIVCEKVKDITDRRKILSEIIFGTCDDIPMFTLRCIVMIPVFA